MTDVLELHAMLADVPEAERWQYLDGEFEVEGPGGDRADAWPAFCTAAVLLGGDLAEIRTLADCMDALVNFSCYMSIGHITVDHWRSQTEAILAELIQLGHAAEQRFAAFEGN